MFDDDESTVDGDVSSLPREESDAYRESEVVTPDPEEESLSDIKQFSEDEFEFSRDEFKAAISPSSSKQQDSYQGLDCDPEEKSFLLDLEQSKDFYVEGLDAPHEYYRLDHDFENVCSMDILEVENSMSGTEDNDEHENSILEEPQDPCSSMEIPSPSISTQTESSHLMPLYQKNFKRVVVDDIVYHKYCKSHRGLLCKSCSWRS
jgi:hypothetical protein